EERSGIYCPKCQRNKLKGYGYEIDKLPACLVVLVNRTKGDNHKSHARLSSLLKLEISTLEASLTDKSCAGCNYELISAVVHIGNDSKSGHYIAYCFNGTHVTRFDDHHVEKSNMSSAISDVSKNGVLLFYHMLPNVPICPPSPESKNRETNDLDGDIVLKPSPTTEHDEATRNDDKSTRKTCDDIYEHFDVDENLDLEHDNPLSNTTEDSDADKGIQILTRARMTL
ncbi:hypothetical protein BSL78_06564, partial [Apostichopus japonicus]